MASFLRAEFEGYPPPLSCQIARLSDKKNQATFLHAAEAGRTLTGCSEERIHQLVAVLASRVRQAAGRHGGSVLERELFGRFNFLVGFVLPLRFQHALEVQARRYICRGIQNTAFKLTKLCPRKLWYHNLLPVPQ